MKSHDARHAVADGVRFLIAGGLNTLLTLVVYQLLLFVAAPSLAYAGSWLCGLAMVVVWYPNRVFAGARRDARARAGLAASYVALFLLGLGTLRLLGEAGVSPRIAILAVLVVTTVANFMVGRLVLRPAPVPMRSS